MSSSLSTQCIYICMLHTANGRVLESFPYIADNAMPPDGLATEEASTAKILAHFVL